jgi:pyridoxal biosynthesis lyase PdxS
MHPPDPTPTEQQPSTTDHDHDSGHQAPLELVQEVARTGRLPVVNFAAGGVATPADAALMMQLGMDGVFVGSGIFKSTDPVKRARAIVQAVTHYKNPKVGACVHLWRACVCGVVVVGAGRRKVLVLRN